MSEEYTIGIGHAEIGGVQLQSKVCASLRVSAESMSLVVVALHSAFSRQTISLDMQNTAVYVCLALKEN